jgi:hypothetical protein
MSPEPAGFVGTTEMKLGRTFHVEVATARNEHARLPAGSGWYAIWGGEAAVRILAYDRDRLGAPVSRDDLVSILLHSGPGQAPAWDRGAPK